MKPLTFSQHGRRIGICLVGGVAAGLLAGTVASASAAVAIGWDAGALGYLAIVWRRLLAIGPADLPGWSAGEDEGRWAITGVLSGAVALSLVAIFLLVADERDPGLAALAILTIACSWTLFHTVFATHYAHRCFSRSADGGLTAGIDFPGDEPPSFVDFAYLAFTVGMTFQVSDAVTRSTAIRRLVLVHGMLSFAFNTVIIAISVSVAAGLLPR